MLSFSSRIKNYRYLCAVIIISLLALLPGYKARAQGLGDPLVQITFGSGFNQFAGALKPDSGFTTYNYVNSSPNDNEYTIANSTGGLNRGWIVTSDHTGDPNGYMMVVNAAYSPGLFYTRRVNGLCGSTTYEFSAWIRNILRGNGILPNVSFTIEDTNGNLLGGGDTRDITDNTSWLQYGFVFTTPASTQSVVLKMTNNAPGGGGNDIAIDDIAFRAYGAPVNIVFGQANTTFCEGVSQDIAMRATTPLQSNFALKFQQLSNNGWVDLRAPDTNPSIIIKTPTVPGIYRFRMVAADSTNINSPACVLSSNFLALEVLPLPVAAIQVPREICMEPTVFKDMSTAQRTTITGWLWDFGDGQTSTEQNPTHAYSRAGSYTVKLTVSTATGCQSQTVSQSIRVITPVATNFTYSTPSCISSDITFTDVSTSAEGNIISRTWDFGDGTPSLSRPDNAAFTHSFDTAKTYQVKLTIVTDKGCTTAVTRAVTVSPLPEANFILPEVCYADYYATFKDSSFVNGSNAGLTYLWNFGDSDAGPGNLNTSTLQNPQHHFSRVDKYTINLTVKSAAGCDISITKTLQINGSPLPKFTVKNAQALCSNNEVFIENQSTATVGVATKVIIYYDTNDRSKIEVDENPYPGKLPFRHTYAPGTYNVEMVAFSGDANVCSEKATATITVAPAPAIAFTPPDTVCLNNGPVPLTYTESTGIAGSATFSGKGISGTVFDPSVAGIGTWTITFVFSTGQAAGCADTIVQNITVKPIPTMVDAGADVSILAGNKATLHASARGSNLKYLWSPAMGLSDVASPNPVVSLTEKNITYTLRVTIADTVPAGPECGVTDTVRVTVLQVPQIPNAFTPNNDGINDLWEIKNLKPYEGATINVFNRYGQRVYSAVGYSKPWDGRINGVDLPVGVYYYIIDPNKGRGQVSGYVTIIR